MITVFLTKVIQLSSSTPRLKILIFLVIIRIWNNKGRFEWEIDNFYDVSDTQNMIDVITF